LQPSPRPQQHRIATLCQAVARGVQPVAPTGAAARAAGQSLNSLAGDTDEPRGRLDPGADVEAGQDRSPWAATPATDD